MAGCNGRSSWTDIVQVVIGKLFCRLFWKWKNFPDSTLTGGSDYTRGKVPIVFCKSPNVTNKLCSCSVQHINTVQQVYSLWGHSRTVLRSVKRIQTKWPSIPRRPLCILESTCTSYAYRIYLIKRLGVYFLAASVEGAFKRDGRLFETGVYCFVYFKLFLAAATYSSQLQS